MYLVEISVPILLLLFDDKQIKFHASSIQTAHFLVCLI